MKCKQCQLSFEITDQDRKFYEEINVTEPTLCPPCRQQRRLAWRNERKLYQRKCDATGESLISNISSDKPFKVFEKEYWFSDNYKPLNYGRDFNFNRSFFEQFKELQKEVPRFSIQQQEPMQNSKYCNFAHGCKDSYFCFDSDQVESCLYSNVLKLSKSCCDCSFTSNSELCYETMNCDGCYGLKFSQNCINCSDSIYLDSCIGCKNCAFSTNLNNKQFYYKNEQLSEEEYNKKIAELETDKYQNLHKHFQSFLGFIKTQPRKFRQGIQNEKVSGDYIYNSKNVLNSYNIKEGWDLSYCDMLQGAKNCLDVSSFGLEIEWMYECTTAGLSSRNCAFCFTAVINSSDLYYCDTAYACQNCFGCVAINHNSYCILNKQYSKEEYEVMREKIINHMKQTGEWGQYFPVELSPFGYNETVAQEYFPLTKEEVIKRGWSWKDEEKPDFSNVTKKIPADKLPDSISEIPDDVLNWAIECEDSGRLFKIQKPELDLYRQMNLPLPHLHPDLRHGKRIKLQNPRVLYNSQCDKCGCDIKTTYSPNRPEKVYCEGCYLKEVY